MKTITSYGVTYQILLLDNQQVRVSAITGTNHVDEIIRYENTIGGIIIRPMNNFHKFNKSLWKKLQTTIEEEVKNA